MSDIEIPNVAVPPLAVRIDDRDMHDNPPSRVVLGCERLLEGTTIAIQVAGTQYINGQFDRDVDPPQLHLDNSAFSAEQIRAFAAVLIDAADELDQWNAWVHATQSDCRTTAITHPR